LTIAKSFIGEKKIFVKKYIQGKSEFMFKKKNLRKCQSQSASVVKKNECDTSMDKKHGHLVACVRLGVVGKGRGPKSRPWLVYGNGIGNCFPNKVIGLCH
jgi:hypothetical protein